MVFPLGWPPRPASGHRSFRFFASGTAAATFTANSFLFHEGNASYAIIGGVDINGRVLCSTTTDTGPVANEFSIEVVRPAASVGVSALSAAFAPVPDGKHIIVSLETIASGELDPTANTATLVAAEVTALADITAVVTGSGAGVLSKVEVRKNFFGGGGIMIPTPFVQPGGASTQVRVGNRTAGGGPMGTGILNPDPILDPYGSTVPHVFASTILIHNDDGTATNTLEFSFDGINVHGVVRGGEELVLRRRQEAGIAVRLGVGTPAFRIHAW